jgi:hypothetical protein
MNKENNNQLKNLYAQSSKHSSYQRLAPALAELLAENLDNTKTRHEDERWDFINASLSLNEKSICDIGGNTGYFTFRSLDAGAKSVEVFEGNSTHCAFVELAADMLGIGANISVHNTYLDLEADAQVKHFDICFLLNVLHHYGDDYGDKQMGQSSTKKHIAHALNKLSFMTRSLVFQLGFNQKGDRTKPLFAHGTKREMIDFIRESCAGSWEIVRIGVACSESSRIFFRNLDHLNIERMDGLGEFLNRPLFIMRSRHCI